MLEFGRADPFGIWRQEAWELLDPAVVQAGEDWANVDAELATGNPALWMAWAGGVPVAAMLTRRLGHVMEVWFAGGSIVPDCLPFLQLVEFEAASFGMTESRLRGRRGWRRVLASHGYAPDGDDLVKGIA